jgi:hypothetical protein
VRVDPVPQPPAEGPPAPADEQKPAPKTPPRKPEPGNRIWDAESDIPPFGPVEVRVLGALKLRVDERHCYISIGLRVANPSDALKVDYHPWGYLRSPGPSLVDDIGNRYVRQVLTPPRPDQLTKRESIYPGKHVDDLVFFEEPVGAAKYVDLSLPGDHVGASDSLVFRIPSKMWNSPQPSKQPPPADKNSKAKQELAEEEMRRVKEAVDRKIAEDDRRAAAEEKKRQEAADKKKATDEEYAAAQVKFARKLIDDGTPSLARERLEKVVKEYGDTKAAAEARELLKSLK